jgi:hypothetical protein
MIMSISAGHSQFGSQLNPDMIRHLFLNCILSYKKKYGAKYGDVVICCDGPGNWRKQAFAYYKAKRAEGRAASPMDWDMIFKTLNDMYAEIDEFFPYKIVKVDGAEGDDVIAVLVRYFQENELVWRDFEESPREILIVSADKDFIQLQVYPGVSQFSPMMKKLLVEPNSKEYRFNKIIRGDAGDGVPNIFSDDDVFVSPDKRQCPATAKKVEPILSALMRGDSVPPEHQRNYDRNFLMIDLLESTPPDIAEAIVNSYKTAKQAPKSELMNYFMKFKMKNLANDLSKF